LRNALSAMFLLLPAPTCLRYVGGARRNNKKNTRVQRERVQYRARFAELSDVPVGNFVS